MLRRHSEIFRTWLLLADLVLVAASWLGAYQLRFHAGIPAPRGIPPLEPYVQALVLILPLWALVFRGRGLYAPRRIDTLHSEVVQVVGAAGRVVLVLVAATFFVRSYFYSRGVILLFAGLSAVSVAVFRVAARRVLQRRHRRGKGLTPVLVAGSGALAEAVIERIHVHPEAGLRVVGVVTDDPGCRRVRGVPVRGRYDQLKPLLDQVGAAQVIVALQRDESHQVDPLLEQLEDEFVDIRLVPDLFQIATLRSSLEDFDGLPVVGLRESPLVGWAAIQKRSFDVAVSALALALAAPLLAAIALGILVSSGRPILYRQERMGLDGRVFEMLKFRTMELHAERATGPVWSSHGDGRVTRLGRWLRAASLDELPQLWNVLRGDMSLVGPRPERPVFIDQFRREVPGYMLRHKVKAGVTGWAQIHRWRGDTSLQERIEHDLYYIQNWSFGLDVRILLMTLWRSWNPSSSG